MSAPASTPTRQHLAAYEVLPAIKREAGFSLDLGPMQIPAMAGGAFVTFGALLSQLLTVRRHIKWNINAA